MTNGSETRKLNRKKQEWDKSLAEFHRFSRKAYKEILGDLKRMLNWMFFYQPKSSSDKWWHLLEVACVLIVIRGIFK